VAVAVGLLPLKSWGWHCGWLLAGDGLDLLARLEEPPG